MVTLCNIYHQYTPVLLASIYHTIHDPSWVLFPSKKTCKWTYPQSTYQRSAAKDVTAQMRTMVLVYLHINPTWLGDFDCWGFLMFLCWSILQHHGVYGMVCIRSCAFSTTQPFLPINHDSWCHCTPHGYTQKVFRKRTSEILRSTNRRRFLFTAAAPRPQRTARTALGSSRKTCWNAKQRFTGFVTFFDVVSQCLYVLPTDFEKTQLMKTSAPRAIYDDFKLSRLGLWQFAVSFLPRPHIHLWLPIHALIAH